MSNSLRQVVFTIALANSVLNLPERQVKFYGGCVVPENIQTPTTEGISLRTPPPTPWIFHFCWELMAPHPSKISTSVTKTPQPLWKCSFSRRKTIKVKEWGILWLVHNGFHQKLVCFCFHLTTSPQSNLICSLCSSLTLNEIDKVTSRLYLWIYLNQGKVMICYLSA